MTPMSPEPKTTFTASRIADALSLTAQRVRQLLEGIHHATLETVGGNEAAAWSWDCLPEKMRNRLNAAAIAAGYRDGRHLLGDPPKRWESKLPWSECSPASKDKAAKLKMALESALARQHDATLSTAEFLALGLADYRRVFGHTITPRSWNKVFNRTVQRAGSCPDFSRPEIYLDENPGRAIKSQALNEETVLDFPEVRRALSQCRDVTKLTKDEQAHILRASIETCDALIDLGQPAKAVKWALFDLLIASGATLAATRDALRKKFDFHYERWKEDRRTVLKDRRVDANRKRARPIPQEDSDIIIAHTLMACGCRVSQGWRECIANGWLSEKLLSRFLSNPASKSHVPRSIRDAVACEVEMMKPNHHGPKQTRDSGAYVSRYWDKVPSMQWYCMDDATLPIYFYVPDGKGWFTLMRGQFILAIDTRSTCILGYALIPERNYNARVIRTLLTHIFDEYGLPDKGFYFERGIWESAKILKGDSEAAIDWPGVERGLTEFGLIFKHAIRARSKPVERVLGALQNYMEGDPGYAGRNEMLEKFEHFQRLKQQVESKKVDPRGKLYDQDAWDNRLHELCQRYNSEQQEGKMTGRLSPEDAMEKFKDPDRRPIRFDASCRFLLAHHKRPVKVTRNGITLRFGKEVFNYKDTQTGALVGHHVLAWFNPEAPEILPVTDLDRSNPFCVARSPGAPALDASPEEMAAAMECVEDHMSYARTRYRTLKAQYDQRFRINAVHRRDIALGQQIEAGRAAIETEQREVVTRAHRIAQLETELAKRGTDPASLGIDRNHPRAEEALQNALEALREDEHKTSL
jgi:hypothetical protein